MSNNDSIIVFDNLLQRTATVGVLDKVQAKAKPFTSPNAHGSLRRVEDHFELGTIAQDAASSLMALFNDK